MLTAVALIANITFTKLAEVPDTPFYKVGVFKTCEDFVTNKISIGVLDNQERFTLNTISDKIRISNADTTIVISPGEVFGFYKGMNTFRYYNSTGRKDHLFSGYYKIEEIGLLTIYSLDLIKQTKYAYSNGSCGEMHELTYANLKKSFKDNHKVLTALKKSFQIRMNPETEMDGKYLINLILKYAQ